ncbi:MAG TPA: hypothetical protein ENN81_10155, partial [Phycisphaerales bacterium]|nr:hypothetical protein [Phycisphaerales bacterium]
MSKRLTCFTLALLCMAGIAAAADNVAVEIWTGRTGTNIEDHVGTGVRPVYPGAANMSWRTNLFELPTGDNKTAQFPGFPNPADNYLGRIFAYIVPPATGAYTFWLCTDDDGRLWLSTDESPDNATQICAIDGWCPANDFSSTGGSGGHTNMRSAARTLTAGQKYYIEAAVKEGGGGDHIYVHWDGPAPIGSSHVAIAEQYLAKVIQPQDLPARNPDPADGARLAVPGKTLSWTPGEYAAQHHVYFGTNATDVANGTGGTDKGLQTENTYLVVGLTPGTTYYWRIDEVNNVTPGSPWIGPVWSFRIASLKAENPTPPDGTVNVIKTTPLSWEAGYGAFGSRVMMGTSPTALTQKSLSGGTSYTPTGLADDTTYYWRIDSTADGVNWVIGDVWSYTTIPLFPVTDPNLVAHYLLDEGEGTTILDTSGNAHHGTALGNPTWVPEAMDGGGLQFDGIDDSVRVGAIGMGPTAARTIAAWAKPNSTGIPTWTTIFGFSGTTSGNNLFFDLEVIDYGGRGLGIHRYGWERQISIGVDLDWHHMAATCTSAGAVEWFHNGISQGSEAGLTLNIADDVRIGMRGDNSNKFNGIIDDCRIYNYAMNAAEIQEVMRGDPTKAYNPKPASSSVVSIDAATPLTWSAGDGATQHDVYFGTDADAVKNATTADAEYKGRQAGTSYAAAVVMGGTYYWRIDEIAGANVSKGRLWSFTVANYLIVDDFESYGDLAVIGVPGQRIWYVWLDGLGYNN